MATFKQVQAGAERAKALSDPTRLSIALELRKVYPDDSVASVDRVADAIARHQSLVSRHLIRLEKAGLVARWGTVGNQVPCALTPLGARMVDAVMDS